MITYHEITDTKKLKELENSLNRNGWLGVPLVLINDNGELLTGTHRYTAAINIGWIDSEIPTILLEEVFLEDEKDFDAVMLDWDYPTSDSGVFVQMVQAELSDEIKSKYGIDCH